MDNWNRVRFSPPTGTSSFSVSIVHTNYLLCQRLCTKRVWFLRWCEQLSLTGQPKAAFDHRRPKHQHWVRQNINPRFSREKGSFFDPKPQGKELLKPFSLCEWDHWNKFSKQLFIGRKIKPCTWSIYFSIWSLGSFSRIIKEKINNKSLLESLCQSNSQDTCNFVYPWVNSRQLKRKMKSSNEM